MKALRACRRAVVAFAGSLLTLATYAQNVATFKPNVAEALSA